MNDISDGVWCCLGQKLQRACDLAFWPYVVGLTYRHHDEPLALGTGLSSHFGLGEVLPEASREAACPHTCKWLAVQLPAASSFRSLSQSNCASQFLMQIAHRGDVIGLMPPAWSCSQPGFGDGQLSGLKPGLICSWPGQLQQSTPVMQITPGVRSHPTAPPTRSLQSTPVASSIALRKQTPL